MLSWKPSVRSCRLGRRTFFSVFFCFFGANLKFLFFVATAAGFAPPARVPPFLGLLGDPASRNQQGTALFCLPHGEDTQVHLLSLSLFAFSPPAPGIAHIRAGSFHLHGHTCTHIVSANSSWDDLTNLMEGCDGVRLQGSCGCWRPREGAAPLDGVLVGGAREGERGGAGRRQDWETRGGNWMVSILHFFSFLSVFLSQQNNKKLANSIEACCC